MVKKIVSNIEKIHQIISETVWLVPHYRHLIRDCYGHQSVLDAHHGEIIIVHRTFWHNWFPSLWALFVGITWGFYFCYPEWCTQYQFWVVVKLYPPASEIYTAAMVVVWSGVIISTALYGLSTDVKDFQYLLILDMNKKNMKNFGFNQNELNELKQFQRRLLAPFALFAYISSIFGSTGQFFQVLDRHLWKDNNIVLVITWFFGFQFWAMYAASCIHVTPGLIIIIHRYIHMKQKQIKKKMNNLTNQLRTGSRNFSTRKSILLMRKYLQLQIQLDHLQHYCQLYDQQTKRLLTIIWSGYTLLSTYLTYVIFLTSIPSEYLPLYYLLFFTHSSLLLLLTYTASKVSHQNRLFNRWNRHTLYSILTTLSSWRKMWKHQLILLSIDNINSIQCSHDSGFSLTNGYVITWNSYIYIFHNISSFFFLIFNRLLNE
nr:uncharacterized protein LOC124500263 [Dermatophagoides farinae]XP_046920277.1 uncharacterized protein LOC124500263 [Dermatophagoides farinae]